ncbi:uncharacterized protein [Triticum aestivum]|uniref:uncharacterized protein n=1 Tax=Triticum aestivum TaxID=4565 RepID=UPI001D00B15D|nr:uncharacterized protein LOC123086498 [Triticum aestivum]
MADEPSALEPLGLLPRHQHAPALEELPTRPGWEGLLSNTDSRRQLPVPVDLSDRILEAISLQALNQTMKRCISEDKQCHVFITIKGCAFIVVSYQSCIESTSANQLLMGKGSNFISFLQCHVARMDKKKLE